MLIKLFNKNPSEKQLTKVVDCLKGGGTVIYPTDTIYGLGCDITQTKAIDRVCQIKGVRLEKAQFSFICYDLSHLADYALPIDNALFRLLKSLLPGPFTFILKASNRVPKLLHSHKKTVGIRVPDNNIPREIVNLLGNPLLSTSLRNEAVLPEYATDPELIYEQYKSVVDIVVDGGPGDIVPSTVVDCTGEAPVVTRQGKGILTL